MCSEGHGTWGSDGMMGMNGMEWTLLVATKSNVTYVDHSINYISEASNDYLSGNVCDYDDIKTVN